MVKYQLYSYSEDIIVNRVLWGSTRGSRGSVSGAMLSSHLSGWFHHSPEVRSHYCLDLKKKPFYILVWWIILVQTERKLRPEALLYLLYMYVVYLLYMYVPRYPSFSTWEATMIAHSVKGRKVNHREVNEGAHRHRGATSGCKREIKQQLPGRFWPQ